MGRTRESGAERAGQGSGAKAGSLGVRVSGCQGSVGVCCRTRPRWPTDVPAFAVTSVLFVGISGLLREREVRSSGKPSLRADSRFLKIWRGVAGSEKPSLNARAGPGDERSPADDRKQAEFTSAVKRSGRRTSLVSVQCVQSKRAWRGTRASENVARPVVMNSRNLLPALNEMTTVQVKGPYSVSRADGPPRHSGFGKCRTASRRNSLPPLSAAGVVQVSCPYSVSGGDGRVGYSGVM